MNQLINQLVNSTATKNSTKQPPSKGHNRKSELLVATESGPAPLKGPLSVHLMNTENDCISQNSNSAAENLSWSKLQKQISQEKFSETRKETCIYSCGAKQP